MPAWLRSIYLSLPGPGMGSQLPAAAPTQSIGQAAAGLVGRPRTLDAGQAAIEALAEAAAERMLPLRTMFSAPIPTPGPLSNEEFEL